MGDTAAGIAVRDRAQKVEELRGADDGERHAALRDFGFLRLLATEVGGRLQAIDADDREHHDMRNAGLASGGGDVGRRGPEEGDHRVIGKGGRIAHVHDDLRARERFPKTFAGDAVHPGARRSGNHLVSTQQAAARAKCLTSPA